VCEYSRETRELRAELDSVSSTVQELNQQLERTEQDLASLLQALDLPVVRLIDDLVKLLVDKHVITEGEIDKTALKRLKTRAVVRELLKQVRGG
jgi:hypothetical protein